MKTLTPLKIKIIITEFIATEIVSFLIWQFIPSKYLKGMELKDVVFYGANLQNKRFVEPCMILFKLCKYLSLCL